MARSHAYIKLSIGLVFTSVTLFTTAAYGQSPATQRDSAGREVALTQGPRLSNPEKKVVAEGRRSDDLESDVAAMKAENAAVREELRKMEANQKALLELVESLKKRLDGNAIVDVRSALPTRPQAAEGSVSSTTPDPDVPTNQPADAGVAARPAAPQDERYFDGIVIWKTPDDVKVPFLLRFNNNTQIRYLNTLDTDATFTDHLGVVREVHARNDITVNRSMFILGGYIFDKRVRYSLTVWTSAGASSIVVAGNIGWQFNKHLTLMGGYTGVPGSRSLVNTFPYYTATDRSMADNFFRPGFTQGVWATGEITKGLSYVGFVGNALNSINISAAKIDTNLLLAGSLWWEPLGGYSEPGKSVNMYDDYFAKKKVRVRFGTSFTRSREDRFSNLDQSSPDNTAIYNSDGVLAFSTGAFAPGVTVDKALYKMLALDGGLKYNGLAINGQYYMRWLSDFEADGPIPDKSTFDHGYELSVSHFVVPKKLAVYVRGSQVFGHFGNSSEYGAGVKWHFLPTERLWLNAELMRVNKAPYSGAFSPYTAGMNGWVPMVQSIIAF